MNYLKLLTAVLCLVTAGANAQVIHEERSLYRNILVQDRGRERCLLFSQRRSGAYQTCIDRRNPDRLVFSYIRMMFSGLLLTPEPKRILLIGLGGGTLPRVLDALYPEAEQDLVEIDPAVVRVAKAYFDFEVGANMRVHERDGRVFVKRALLEGQQWDLILLDAFTDEYIPEHLLTREFLEELKSLLSEGGVVVANTFANSRLYHHESATYQAAFPTLASLRVANSFNRILIGLDRPWPEQATLDARAAALAPALDRYGVDIERYARALRTRWDFDSEARVLTDRYAPANLLQGRSVLGPLQKD